MTCSRYAQDTTFRGYPVSRNRRTTHTCPGTWYSSHNNVSRVPRVSMTSLLSLHAELDSVVISNVTVLPDDAVTLAGLFLCRGVLGHLKGGGGVGGKS